MIDFWLYDDAPTPAASRGRLACLEVDPELFFAQEDAGIARAKEVCAQCPSRAECLSGALERLEPWGVWGGELFMHGVVIARKPKRGRPRKDAAA